MKKTKSIALWLCCALAAALAGCEDNRGEFLDDYQTRVYFRNGGEQVLTLYKVGENSVYDIPICKSGRDTEGTGHAVVALMDQTQLDIYNLSNGTDFAQLPSDLYEFLTELEFDFAPEDTYKVARVELYTDRISDLQAASPDRTYVLALQVYSDRTVSDGINLLIVRPDIEVAELAFQTAGAVSYAYTSSSPVENAYNNFVQLSMDNRWNFSVGLEVCDQEWLDAYNAANDTSYELLPAEAYRLPGKVDFVAGSNRAEFAVTIDRSPFGLLQEYALPVRLVMPEQGGKEQFELSEEVYLVNLRLDPDQIVLTADMAESPYTHTGDGQGIAALFDGDASAASWWHSYYGGGPLGDPLYGYYIDIHLQEPLSAIVLRYCTRSNPNGVPAEIRVGVSDDGETWTEIGYVASGLPTDALAWCSLPVFTHTASFRHIRFGIVTSAGAAGGVLNADATSACTALSELELYGADLLQQ